MAKAGKRRKRRKALTKYRRYRPQELPKGRLTPTRHHFTSFLGNHGAVTCADFGKSSLDPSRVLVVDGGPNSPVMPSIPSPTLVIAADKGFEHARALGLSVDVVVGDFDSLSSEQVENIDPGVTLEQHDVDKDESDLLAIGFAYRVGAEHIDIITGGSGRLDHLRSVPHF